MDMRALMQQANQLQKKVKKIEEELDANVYEGNNNGVTIQINGKNEVQSVSIDDDLINKDDKDMLQDMIMIAMNDAVSKAAADREEKMGTVTAGVRIPGMM